ncbi:MULTISPECIES: glycine C-acetyltransferase [Cysteiniphilum]|uniref:2-amino-3-ketobutyrate coenzyme A ligase n=1 Tax=Cysteiniphilum litorale TaxID=2056700 RepID=A0A8J2Z557_9GAMM|nr:MULTISPECIES: glycine C-acetyltransferase [Cysteiniphilum]GGF99937.1 2-amino-3-ketobutyrate coenzyme A ligase [Cysteiniphilum litorale]
MNNAFYDHLRQGINEIKEAETYKGERIINSPQSSDITLKNGAHVINFCANNYLGLADNKDLVETAKKALDQYGYGAASVRFICGTQTPHRELEDLISQYLKMEETIVFPSCFDANGGVFESILTAEDAVISDALNHASIIDGVRLCKAMRFRYKNNDMSDLEAQLQAADEKGARFKLIVTDGVFSMDGIIANLKGVCDLADKYNALVMVDDSHATGFIGEEGRGTPSYCGVEGRVDIITSTLGKALGGASGGFVSARAPVAEMLKQKARPYLFSNALAPMIAATSMAAIKLAMSSDERRDVLQRNQKHFRQKMTAAGFDLIPGEHPIIPVMLYEEKKAAEMAEKLLEKGIYVIAFSYPVVPKGLARIRTQMSAAHTLEQIDRTVQAFTEVGKEMGII